MNVEQVIKLIQQYEAGIGKEGLSGYDRESRKEIRAEERGEHTACAMILASIRKQLEAELRDDPRLRG